MAQVTLYLPDALAKRLRLEAKRAGLSLSAYLASLATRATGGTGWPADFKKLYGACRGTLRPAPDPAPEDVDFS